MNKEIANRNNTGFSLNPRNFEEAMQFSKLIAESDLAPKDYKGKPANVLVAIQMGNELGLHPMQAIQNIAVINGRPSLYGDAMLGLIKIHPDFISIEESIDGDTAYCTIKRKNEPEHTTTFSKADAKLAGLSSKPGPWTQYPERMLAMRARSFCIRNTFPDVMKGLHVAEEAQDMIDISGVTEATIKQQEHHRTFEGKPLSQSFTIDPELLQKHLEAIAIAPDMDILRAARMAALTDAKGDAKATNDVSLAALTRKNELNKPIEPVQSNKEWLGEYGAGEEK